MKFQLPLIALTALTFASCDNDTTTTASTTDTAVVTSADPNMITTTTTTTTTRPAFEPKTNVQYMDLRTRKLVTVRVDTVHHYVVNAETNQPLDWFLEPGTTDTFYGRNMQMANGYIDYRSPNEWIYDESRANMSGNTGSEMSTSASDVDKIKTDGDETKVKLKDGSKIKTDESEGKVKVK
jgi:hypothetical protein